jgi:ActR/RegA family two-component response regulator
MATSGDSRETILIVDDEQPVRKTFQEWLESAHLGCRILSVADAESALVQANQNTIDLAILDWNLGAGNDGLQLLEDLYLFNADIVAIMITGYAHQATPLDAMRMGVRDYLDKNQDLDRETFLTAVRRQLDRVRPAKRERQLHRSLAAFREAVEKILPLVQSAATLNDPVPLPQAIRNVLQFLLRTTGARDGVLLARSYDADKDPAETCRVYDINGSALEVPLVPFARSLAGTALSLQQPSAMTRLEQTAAAGGMELQPFERGRQSLLAAPMAIAPGVGVVLELFDKQGPGGELDESGFNQADHLLAGAAADLGADLLRQALAERKTHQVLLDAVAAALGAGDSVVATLETTAAQRLQEAPPAAVLDRLREGLRAGPGTMVDADDTLRLVEAIRALAVRHGSSAVQHCIVLVEQLRKLLDAVTGA